MHLSRSSGEAAALVGSTEPVLNNLVRKGRINPAPKVVAGRRLWEPPQILQAAELLGLLNDDLRCSIEKEVTQ
jgi:hypothetical protein